MMRVENLDNFLIDRFFQRFARWTQVVFGIDSIRWTKFFLVGMVLTIPVAIGVSIVDLAVHHVPIFFSLPLSFINLYVAWMIVQHCLQKYFRMRILEKLAERNQEQRTGNPFRIMFFRTRILSMAVSAFLSAVNIMAPNTFFFWITMSYCLGTVVEYFLACDPLPPQKSKIRQWLESWKKVRILEPALEH